VSDGPFYLWWVSDHGSPPTVGQYGEFAGARKGWDAATEHHRAELETSLETARMCLEAANLRIDQLAGDLIAAGDGHPVLVCPNCKAPSADYDGFGLLACPRDPACYCTHPGSDDGACTICGLQEADHE
jgi:hypothetical protein